MSRTSASAKRASHTSCSSAAVTGPGLSPSGWAGVTLSPEGGAHQSIATPLILRTIVAFGTDARDGLDALVRLA